MYDVCMYIWWVKLEKGAFKSCSVKGTVYIQWTLSIVSHRSKPQNLKKEVKFKKNPSPPVSDTASLMENDTELNCLKAASKKENTWVPTAAIGESNRLHNIFSASQEEQQPERHLCCIYHWKYFSYRWRSSRCARLPPLFPASSSSSSSCLARRWRRVGLMRSPCSADPLPRLALAWRKAVGWLLVKVGVQNTPDGCQEKALNLVSIAFWAILWWVNQWKKSSDRHTNIFKGQAGPSTYVPLLNAYITYTIAHWANITVNCTMVPLAMCF